MLVLFFSQSIGQSSRRHFDVVVGEHRVLRDVRLQLATFDEPFRKYRFSRISAEFTASPYVIYMP